MNAEPGRSAAVGVTSPRRNIRNAEFIAVTALITAMGALSIDTILPAFPEIRSHLGLAADSTRVSLLVTGYLLGMGLGQIPAGIVSDRFGRKRALTVFVAVYMVGVVGSMVATSLPLMVLARVVWGLGGAGPRVVAIAMVRDSHEGVRMAQVLSYVQSIFVIVPVLAPSLGSLALHLGGWRATVAVPAGVAVVLLVWMLRVPETLAPGGRQPISTGAVRRAFSQLFRHRPTMLYALAMAFLFGCISSYISLAETIIDDVYDRKSSFPIIFGVIAASMGVSTLVNARFVGRLGLDRMLTLMPRAAAAIAIVLAALSVTANGRLSFAVFAVGMALLLSAQTLVTPNVNSAAMQPHGNLAGLAAGTLGMISTIGGAILGTLTSQLHDGSTRTITVAIAVFLVVATMLITAARRDSYRLAS